MRRLAFTFFIMLLASWAWAQQREITLSGYVEDGFLKTPLLHAQVSVCRTDSTVLVDSATVMPFGEFVNGELKLKSTKFTAKVRTSDKALLWHVQMKGYNDVWQQVNIGKADNVDIPTTGLRKVRETQLDEVLVKATRVKMVYRGDTIVYNADAFNLPQGSMLDDLIRQMPGVTLNESGEIFVNGRKVDELLLGSQSFMRGNKKVLMENLPYYTVKNIKVYDKRTDKSEALGYDVEPKKFVMDVNLKDEFRNGYIANAELAGGGSLYKTQTPQPQTPQPQTPQPPGGGDIGRDKPMGGSLSHGDCLPLQGAGGSGAGGSVHWLGRAFLLGFTDRTRLTLFGNINNVNETRHIGESDRWSPASMPSSMTTTRSAAAEFFYHSDKVKETLNADFTSTTNTTDMHQRREQFLQGSTPLSTSSSWDRSGTRQLKLHNSLSLSAPLWGLHNLDFYHLTRDGSFHSAFDQWSDTLVASKRSIGMSEGKAWGIKAESQGAFNLNKEKQQHMDFFLVLAYDRDESRQANRYETQQFSAKQAVATRNSDDLLNSSLNGLLLLSTGRKIGKGMHVGIGETVTFSVQHHHDYLYHPDTLLLPSQLDMLTAISDPHNSYDSHNSHVVGTTRFSISKKATHKMKIYGNLPPMTYTPWEFSLNVPIHHEQLDYQRGMLDTLTTQNTLFLNANAGYRLLRGEGTHDLRASASFDQRSIELLNCLGWHDDSQPLIVRQGNPDLKHYAATKVAADYYNHNGRGHQQSFHLGTNFTYDHRNVAQSVQYAPTTGVYTYKPMNVSGAYLLNGNFDFSRTLDSKHYWSIQTNADASLHHSVDHAMLAGETESHLNAVNTLSLHDNAYIQYNKGQLNLRATGDISWRHSEGKMLDFNVLNAFDYQYGLSGRYTLPRLSTTLSLDGNVYSRRGYGSSDLNTDDFVLNASLSQPFLKGKLIARIEAFDLLHQLSNTQYAVNAQGRTITWYRSLPHYAMLHLVYHWNKNPKKK